MADRTRKKSRNSKVEPDAAASVNIDEFMAQDSEVPQEALDGVKPKRKYSKRRSNPQGGALGKLMLGFGSLIAGGTAAITGQDAPLTSGEGQMLEYVGDCVEQFGDTSALDENMGRYGMYLLGGAFAAIALGRVVPYFIAKRRRQIPEVTQVQ